MAPLSATDLQALAYEAGDWCVSIYLSANPTEAALRQSERLAQAIEEARRQLEAARVGRRLIARLLRPLELLTCDHAVEFVENQACAIFRSQRLIWQPRLPLACPDLIVVDRRFSLWPLLTMLSAASHFYLLTLEPANACLLSGSATGLEEVRLVDSGLSCNFDDELARSEHYTRAVALGASSHWSRAMVAEVERPTEEIRDFFQWIDRQICARIGVAQAPLVLAGPPELLALYREVSRYPLILDQAIVGDPLIWSLAELHAQAWAIIGPHFSAELGHALGRYRDLAGGPCASSDLARIIPAARDGRIAHLFVALANGDSLVNAPCVSSASGGERSAPALIERAILETWLGGGLVYMIEPALMPERGVAMTAVFRG